MMATSINKKKTLSSKLGSALAVFENTIKANQEHNVRDTVIKSGSRRSFYKNTSKKPTGNSFMGSNYGSKNDHNDEAATKSPVVEVTVTTPKKSDDGPKGGVHDRQRDVINRFQVVPAAPTKPTKEGYNDNETQRKRNPSTKLLVKAFEVQKRDGLENSPSKVQRNFKIPYRKNKNEASGAVSSVVGIFESLSIEEGSDVQEEGTKVSRKDCRFPATMMEVNNDNKAQSLTPLVTPPQKAPMQNTISDGIGNKIQNVSLPPCQNVLKRNLTHDASSSSSSSSSNNNKILEEYPTICGGEGRDTTTYSPKSHRERHETDISALLGSTTATAKNKDGNFLETDSSSNDGDDDDEYSYYELEVITNEDDDDDSQNDQLSQLNVVEDDDGEDDCSLWEEKTVDTEEELLWEEETVDEEEFIDLAFE